MPRKRPVILFSAEHLYVCYAHSMRLIFVQTYVFIFYPDIFHLKLYVFVQLLPSKQVYIERLFSHARWQAAAKTEHRMTDACTATVSYYGAAA